MHSEKLSLEELYMQCKIVGIPWMIILKDRTYRAGGLLKVKNVEKKTEVEISRDDLSEYMLRVVRNKEIAPAPQEKATPASVNPKHHEPSVLSTQSSLDIVVSFVGLYWIFYRNTVAGSFKSLLQYCDRISNTISYNIL
jgi:hypothetical protein